MDASPEFPIHFLKIYSTMALCFFFTVSSDRPVLPPAAVFLRQCRALKVHQPDRLAVAPIDRNESNVGMALQTVPGGDRPAFARQHGCWPVAPHGALMQLDRIKRQPVHPEVLQDF